MLNRHEARLNIIFALYQHLLLDKNLLECINDNIPEPDDFVEKIANDLAKNEIHYIYELSQHLNKWTFDRLSYVEQAILLEAASEILSKINEPAISIDEAIIFAKQYCDDDSYKYINGVLDNLCKK